MSAVPLRAVLFDLDGTLVDTLPDIASGMNAALAGLGLRPLPIALIGSFIGNGSRVLTRRVLDQQDGLGGEERARLVDPLFAAYVRHYESQVGVAARIFPGVLDCLSELSVRGLKLGVVTNALQHIAGAILEHFRIAPYMRITVGGDRVARQKPHPEPLWEACRALGVEPQATLMVGDSANDILAARAAGCPAVAVPHGYSAGIPINTLGCEVIEDLTMLPHWIALRDLSGINIRPASLH